MDVPIVNKRYHRVVKLETEFQHENLKVVKFIMELHYGSSKEGEASVKALLHGLLDPCK